MCKQVKLLPCLASLELAVVSVASCGLEFSEPQQPLFPGPGWLRYEPGMRLKRQKCLVTRADTAPLARLGYQALEAGRQKACPRAALPDSSKDSWSKRLIADESPL